MSPQIRSWGWGRGGTGRRGRFRGAPQNSPGWGLGPPMLREQQGRGPCSEPAWDAQGVEWRLSSGSMGPRPTVGTVPALARPISIIFPPFCGLCFPGRVGLRRRGAPALGWGLIPLAAGAQGEARSHTVEHRAEGQDEAWTSWAGG